MKKIVFLVILPVLLLIAIFGLGKLYSKKGADAVTQASPGEVVMEARYYEKLEKKQVKCHLCFRECVVPDGKRGFCRNRENRKGKYYTLTYSRPCAVHVDPIEKEPVFHMRPGSNIFCLAAASCNFRCKYCHNWHISQSSVEETTNYSLTPEEAVSLAIKLNCPTISFTYTEPTASYEYMYDIVKLAREQGLKNIFHTNGAMNPEPLKALLEYMDAVTVDLKGFDNKFYHDVSSARLAPVLRTLKTIKQTGLHLEIVNLVVPTLNDDMERVQIMCKWIVKNLGPDVPVHFNRFSPSHKLKNLPPTPIETLEKAHKIARECGLKYVYIGNYPGHKANSTYCPHCNKTLIKRIHFRVLEDNIKNGKCKFCRHEIPGIW